MVEEHCERRPALRYASQRRRVSEHLGQRHVAFDGLDAVLHFHSAHASAAGIEVAHDVADVFVGQDIDFLARDYIACVKIFLEDMQRYARVIFAVYNGPIKRSATLV